MSAFSGMDTNPSGYGPGAEPGVTSLQHLFAILRRRWPIVAAVTALCVLAPVINALISDSTYQASSRVVFNVPSLSEAALEVDRSSSDPERDAATAVLVASSPELADRVRSELNLNRSVEDLLDQVDVSAEANADVLAITASDESPRVAARIADGFASAFVESRSQSDSRAFAESRARLRRQIEALPVGSPQRATLEESLQRLAISEGVAPTDARVIGAAVVPEEPSSLNPLRAGLLGLVLGLALGIAIAFLVEALDRRVRTIEDIERLYRLRVLAVVPRKLFRRRSAQERAGELEPFRILRNALEFAAAAGSNGVLVTSAVPSEGKTTVAVDLAHAIALTGRRAVLVELDLRRPTFGTHFGLTGRQGVTTALLGRASASELLQQPLPYVPDLWVLPAGPLPPNPAELLELPALDALLEELADEDTTLIIDAPPLVPVVDAQVLLRRPHIDAALIVSRIGVTTRDEIGRARAILDTQGAHPLGVVVTGHGDSRRYGYGAYKSPGMDPAREQLAAASQTVAR